MLCLELKDAFACAEILGCLDIIPTFPTALNSSLLESWQAQQLNLSERYFQRCHVGDLSAQPH